MDKVLSTTTVGHERLIYMLAELAQEVEQLTQQLESALAQAEPTREKISEAFHAFLSLREWLKKMRVDESVLLTKQEESVVQLGEVSISIDKLQKRIQEIEHWIERGIEDQSLFEELGRAASLCAEKKERRDSLRTSLKDLEHQISTQKQLYLQKELEIERMASQIKALQHSLPDPHLFAWLGLARLAKANVHMRINQKKSIYLESVQHAVLPIEQMHKELRAGRYRLDRFGDLLAGRHESTVQAMYAYVAIGDLESARRLFSLATDENMFFHHIFNVFRMFLLGDFLSHNHERLNYLTRVHRYDFGLWRAYVQAFVSLQNKNSTTFMWAIQQILKIEDQSQQQMLGAPQMKIPGIDSIHVPVLALTQLALSAGMTVSLLDPRVVSLV